MIDRVIQERFERLEKDADLLHSQAFIEGSGFPGMARVFVNQHDFVKWKVQVKTLLVDVCGENSEYLKQFEKIQENVSGSTNYDIFDELKATFLAAKEDFENGYLLSIKALIQAEVFDSQLEQAKELLKSGYLTPAAVIAGTVLETALRELCNQKGIEDKIVKDGKVRYKKLDEMNIDLRKVDAYNLLRQKRITALADIRNNAAHGNVNEFKKEDVQNMIEEISQLLANGFES